MDSGARPLWLSDSSYAYLVRRNEALNDEGGRSNHCRHAFESWEDGFGGNATLLTQGLDAYIWGPDGMALERVESDGTTDYLWQDSIGSIIGVTGATGSIRAAYNYDAWGRRTGNPTTAYAGTLGFTGEVTDWETDIQYLRARYYDPKTAQFLTRDPQEATTGQPYLYAAGNPTMFTDPSGESIIENGLDLAGGVVHGASFGKLKPGWANSCSGYYFVGSQVGGAADPFKKLKVVAKAGGALGLAVGIGGRNLRNGVGKVDPSVIRYSQKSIRPGFRERSDGVDELIAGLKAGTVRAEDIPPIRIVTRNGKAYSLDNRRLYAFKEAGVPIRYRNATPDEIAKEAYKFDSTNDGVSIRVRGR